MRRLTCVITACSQKTVDRIFSCLGRATRECAIGDEYKEAISHCRNQPGKILRDLRESKCRKHVTIAVFPALSAKQGRQGCYDG